MRTTHKLALAVLAAVLAFVGCVGKDELELEQERYCEMVELFVASKGDKGWPDYEDTYAESCTTQKED